MKEEGTLSKRVSNDFGFYIASPKHPEIETLNIQHPPTLNFTVTLPIKETLELLKVSDQGSGVGCETLNPTKFQFVGLAEHRQTPRAIIASIFPKKP